MLSLKQEISSLREDLIKECKYQDNVNNDIIQEGRIFSSKFNNVDFSKIIEYIKSGVRMSKLSNDEFDGDQVNNKYLKNGYLSVFQRIRFNYNSKFRVTILLIKNVIHFYVVKTNLDLLKIEQFKKTVIKLKEFDDSEFILNSLISDFDLLFDSSLKVTKNVTVDNVFELYSMLKNDYHRFDDRYSCDIDYKTFRFCNIVVKFDGNLSDNEKIVIESLTYDFF